ncbi:MAG: FAD-dependent monooxygenase [Rubrivivax sp.]|nr:FAD-dependent monooxygenase [Rubrivivax sp.]
MNRTAWRIAVVGAGPVGLALALHGARLMPEASFTVFDARPADRDVSADPRTLALALGSVRFLQRLGAWPAADAAPIREVHVSQVPPPASAPGVWLRAADLGELFLGAVLSYGALLAPLQQAWQRAVAAEPGRLALRLGTPVAGLQAEGGTARLEVGGAAEACDLAFDLAVVAEGGVFADQARKAVGHDYAQTAWVGTVRLQGCEPGRAFERFTRQGPLALLPLPEVRTLPGATAPVAADTVPAALVWCVDARDDPVMPLADAQRLALLNALLPGEAGRAVQTSPLKAFALGLNAERTLVQGRAVRIGNAAQTLHPVAGQGLNLGLRDVHALVQALRDAADLDQALRRVEWARAPDRWATIGTTDFLARSFTWQAPGVAALRALGLGALQALPPLRSRLARQMMFGWR